MLASGGGSGGGGTGVDADALTAQVSGMALEEEDRLQASHQVSPSTPSQPTHDSLAAASGSDAADAAPASRAPAASKRVAGLEGPLQALRELVGWPRLFADQGRQLGVRWPRGLLLHGPPGCGKTLLVSAVAGGQLSEQGSGLGFRVRMRLGAVSRGAGEELRNHRVVWRVWRMNCCAV